jgi:HD-GYP domain-containing protein (c-di-GMP phosphodiesterase class II)
MSRIARIVAQDLAQTGKHHLDDEQIEKIFLFSPLHDLGKIAIPDRVLLKAGPLTDEERAVMKTHSAQGAAMVDSVLANFGLQAFPAADVLRNIAELHHEALDGSGYPRGLKGNEIPIEARIVAVADVFDALTSRRPYKKPWTNQDAVVELRRLARSQLDVDCVEALVRNLHRVAEVQSQFPDRPAQEAP